ncbi:rod shape-determining protein RodA [Neisseria sp. HMSC066H01]|uniref:Mth938-like domain-containing protein n=1 Tax=Neisseria sp. HMSC066H01 TaxID=1715031 RepID=UPI0008AA0662|nr:MTH938/NDUFAF3 family protein [Neisseria sp. HMSC066H01]OHQ26654.1 rod shape-determining protein RodA [Neisseria sp. HMSC066H01]
MKITENHIDETASFFSSSQGILQIGKQTYSEPICWQDGKISIIPQTTIEELNEQIVISAIETAENRPGVIIIGTGAKQKFLHPKIAVALSAYGIGFECMNTASACRTLVLLQGEGRSTWAWLWP